VHEEKEGNPFGAGKRGALNLKEGGEDRVSKDPEKNSGGERFVPGRKKIEKGDLKETKKKNKKRFT